MSAEPGYVAPLREVAEMFAELGEQLPVPPSLPGSPPVPASLPAYDALTAVAVRRISGADWVSVTILRDGVFRTVSASDERAVRADRLQYELRSGPCVDAITSQVVSHPRDLRVDPRWPVYGPRVHAELGVGSMVSYRLGVDRLISDVIAGLNVYATRPGAFDDAAVEMGRLLAAHATMAVAAQISTERAADLERALATSRDIGVAMGVLMAQHTIDRTSAFEQLRLASQNSNRKLRDIAVEVGDTGSLPMRS